MMVFVFFFLPFLKFGRAQASEQSPVDKSVDKSQTTALVYLD